MGDLFKALTGGLARFVFAWMMPSIVTLGVFSIFLLPEVKGIWPFDILDRVSASGPLAGGVLFAFMVLLFSILFAYASLPIYRVLEGYSLPSRLQRWLRSRHIREWRRLKARESFAIRRDGVSDGLVKERLNAYPLEQAHLRPTALGNALSAMEAFGSTRYGLDSQSVWYELQAVVPDTVRRQTEEGRAPVDFFISSVAHFALLSPAFLVVSIYRGSFGLFVASILTGAVVPLSYRMAVRGVKDWGGSVRALVNLGRLPLADALGLRMPGKLAEEQEMWATFYWAIEQRDTALVKNYDLFRFVPKPPPG